MGVKSRKQLEVLWSKFFCDEEVRSSVEALILAEEGYKDFMRELDEDCKTYEDEVALPIVDVGDSLQMDISLVEAHSGKKVPLSNILQKTNYTLFVFRKHYV